MHPADSIRGMKSERLRGRKIVLGITGSIAAVECLELARELIRHGAEVHTVLSAEGAKIATPYVMEFATGNPVTTELDGRTQHVALLGDFWDRADLLLIAPCTANTVSKIANGIDDTPVTTMATIALGTGVPILVAPAMHASMYRNPFVQQNLERLAQAGMGMVGPHMEGKKARIADNDEIVSRVIRMLFGELYFGKRVLVIGGSSEEPIDDMRIITNRGTGETAVALAQAAYELGAAVELWMGRCSVPLPSHIRTRRFRTVAELEAMVPEVQHDLVLVPAALADFAPKRSRGKISSESKNLKLELEPVPKILPLLVGKAKVVGFKAESGLEEKELLARAKERLNRYGLNAIVANDLGKVSPGRTEVLVLRKGMEPVRLAGAKSEVAWSILTELRKLI